MSVMTCPCASCLADKTAASRGKRTAEDFEVLEVCVFCVHIKLDSRHGQIDCTQMISVSGCCSRLMSHTYGRCCRRSGSRERWPLVSSRPSLTVERFKLAHPVPHCSTLVRFNWRRPLTQANNSCLPCLVSNGFKAAGVSVTAISLPGLAHLVSEVCVLSLYGIAM